MHRIISLLLATAAVLIVFGTVSKFAEANKAIFSAGSQDELEQAKQISLDILRGRATLRAIGRPDDYKIKRVEIDGLKMAHTHVQQVIDGVPVWEGEAIVHLSADGSLSSITDELKDAVAINTTPNLSARRAMRLAVDSYDGKAQLSESPTADLYIYRGEDRDHLVWRVVTPRVDGSDATSIPVYFIDAHTGDLVDQYDNLQTGTGTPLYYNGGQATTINTSQGGSTYYLEDLTRKQGTFNMNSTGSETTGTGGTQSRYSGTDDIWGEASGSKERAAVDAHIGAAKTFDYYKNVHGRNGIDGNYGPGSTTAGASSSTSLLVSRVHFGTSGRYNNAFWNGTTMSYGDGDGTNFTPLTTLDICGHEMTHGVTERSAGLTYSKESGALNESWSDVMGSMVELYANGGTVTTGTWLIGEQAYTPGIAGDALRSMKDPHSVGDPDHYSLRLYPGSCTASSSNDNCGVHTNSSISNHAYYLIAAGGTNRVSGVSVTGIGTSAAEKIWYRALTVYMTASSNFAGARTATLNAASDLFGSTSDEYNGVATGWCAVGVGTCPSGTPSPTPTATATVTPSPTPTVTPTPTPTPSSELVTNGSFEVSQSPWISSGSGFFYTASNTYPHTGSGYIYMGVNNNTAGSVYQTVTIPSTAPAAMTFWLNVVSSETTSTQYDKLYVEVRDTSNRLLTTLATYSNANKAAAGAYSQKSFSLASYRGRTVRLQFRWTTDVSLSTTFRVDDVSLK